MRRPRKRTIAVVSVVAAALVATGLGVTLTSNDDPAPVAATTPPPASPVLPGVALQAQEDKQELDKLLATTQKTGYDCQANENVKKIADLRLCPDYVATVSFGETGNPAIVTPIAPDGVYPVEITAEPIKSCTDPKSSDFTGKASCEQLYRIRWTVYSNFVPLGYNEENILENGTTNWQGPLAQDVFTGDRLLSAKDNLSLEIYIGDPALNSFAEPLDDARLAKS